MPRRQTPATPELRSAAARLGAAVRHHPDLVEERRRDLAAQQIADAITHTLADSPPLTAEQAASIMGLLVGRDHSAVGAP